MASGEILRFRWLQHEIVKGVEGPGFGIPGVELDRSGAPANLAPILDIARENLCDLLKAKRRYWILRRDEHGHAVQREDMGFEFDALVLDRLGFLGLNRARHLANLGLALQKVRRRGVAAMRLKVDAAGVFAVVSVELIEDLLGIGADDFFKGVALFLGEPLDGVRHQLGADGVRTVNGDRARGRLRTGRAGAVELRQFHRHHAEFFRFDDEGPRIGRHEFPDDGQATASQGQGHLATLRGLNGAHGERERGGELQVGPGRHDILSNGGDGRSANSSERQRIKKSCGSAFAL